jgi:hypothetical protein
MNPRLPAWGPRRGPGDVDHVVAARRAAGVRRRSLGVVARQDLVTLAGRPVAENQRGR